MQGLTFASLAALPPTEQAAALRRDAGHTARLVYQAACLGLVEAQTTLGQMLLDGRGTPRDAAAARRWFTLAAREGHAPAANMLGRCLERGWGGPPDAAGAASCYRQAAEASLDWGQYNLANMLLRGRGVAQDVRQSLAWFKAAARQGHAKSMNLVGRFLEEGWAGPVDLVQAEAWYLRAAHGGDFRAKFNLATLLAGRGQVTEAASWFAASGADASADFRRLAAEHLLAQPESALRQVGLDLAALCCKEGGPDDFCRYGKALAARGETRLAAAWIEIAARQGHAEAAATLSLLERGWARPAR